MSRVVLGLLGSLALAMGLSLAAPARAQFYSPYSDYGQPYDDTAPLSRPYRDYGQPPPYPEGRSVNPDEYRVEQESPQTTRELVRDSTGQPAGTLVVDTRVRKLYLVLGNGSALEYGIGVGRAGFAWKGTARVARKAEWPTWTPPGDMLKRRPDLPRFMDGGLDNPLGARALYLYQGKVDTLFRIHGTNEPDTIGQAVSSGCIRMMNADVIDLYRRVPVGTRVVVL